MFSDIGDALGLAVSATGDVAGDALDIVGDVTGAERRGTLKVNMNAMITQVRVVQRFFHVRVLYLALLL